MEYTESLDIALPQERVLALISDPAHFPKWLRGLVSHELVSGEQGQVGAVSRVEMRAGRGTMEARETITRREPTGLYAIPPGQVVHYERELVAEGMWSAAREHLTAVGPELTRWESVNEYRFDSRAMRLLAPLMTRSFRAQQRRHMENFRAFAERGVDVRGAES